MESSELGITKVALNLVFWMMLLLSLTFYVNTWSPFVGSLLSFLIVLAYVFLPVKIIQGLGQDLRSFNIYAHRIETVIDSIITFRKKKANPDLKAIGSEINYFLLICFIVLIPFAAAYAGYAYLISFLNSQSLGFSLSFPPQLIELLMTQIFVVALPEEIFWRGFVQGSLLKKWPNERYICGLPCGRAVVITNVFFALAHFVLGFSLIRLLTFFPGLIFSAMVIREKSLLSAILFHATCNIFAIVMHESLRLI